jgi:hypothetical protein
MHVSRNRLSEPTHLQKADMFRLYSFRKYLEVPLNVFRLRRSVPVLTILVLIRELHDVGYAHVSPPLHAAFKELQSTTA